MMVYLDLSPYHENLVKYWNEQSHWFAPKGNFWIWVKQEYGADVARNLRPEKWKFENEQDAMMFILRWS